MQDQPEQHQMMQHQDHEMNLGGDEFNTRRKKIPKRIFRTEAFAVASDFMSLDIQEKQHTVERLFSTTRYNVF